MKIVTFLKNISFCIFFVFCLYLIMLFFKKILDFKYYKEAFSDKKIEIVIARFQENIDWLNNYPFSQYPVIVYNKGNNNGVKINNLKQIHNIKNIGRESHSYLYHIIRNYDNLADITIFLPGSADNTHKISRSTRLIEEIASNNQAVFIGQKYNDVKNDLYSFELKNYNATNSENTQINPSSKLSESTISPFGKWFESIFKNIKIQHVSYNSIFSISKEDILQHPKSYYQHLINELTTENPEQGHYFERSWEAVFYPLNNTKYIDLDIIDENNHFL